MSESLLDPSTRAFYCRTLAALASSGVPHLVGGASAVGHYTGIERHTKDFDIFTRPSDYRQVMDVLARCGCQTELTFPHWLGKAYCGDDFIDVIFSSGNAIANVDDEWFEHAVQAEVLNLRLRLCPPEEMIWAKSFVMERERYDGADILHLLRARASSLDGSASCASSVPILARASESSDPVWFCLSVRARGDSSFGDRRTVASLARRDGRRSTGGTALSRDAALSGPIPHRCRELGISRCAAQRSEHMTRDEIADWTAAARQESEPSQAPWTRSVR